jgi:hypothetical protein
MTIHSWTSDENRVKWRGIVAGLTVGMALQIGLTLLGLAVGVLNVDVRDAEPSKTISMMTAIWTGLTMLICAFTGGYVAARVSRLCVPTDGIFQGAVLWGVTWVLSALLTTTAAAAVLGMFTSFGAGLQIPSVNLANVTIHRMGAAAWWLFTLSVLTFGMTIFGGAVGARVEGRSPVLRDEVQARRQAV